ncbi:MAG: COG4280 domain-containing protein [Pseudonocardiaceae bacterium]
MSAEVVAVAGALFIAVFLACAVEAVEALTIVLAAGLARDWRSARRGVYCALAVLVAVIAAFGPAVSAIPLSWLRLVVGGLLLVFGLQWLRKAVLRAGGHKTLHDETAIFNAELVAARGASRREWGLIGDGYAFTLSFKGVLLEGLEVVFIALTFGANQHDIPLAALAAGCAVTAVTAIGLMIRAPLARVPENTVKFIVGVMLTAFGIFWSAEGAGASWPGAETALLVIIPAVALGAFVLVAALRWLDTPGDPAATDPSGLPGTGMETS